MEPENTALGKWKQSSVLSTTLRGMIFAFIYAVCIYTSARGFLVTAHMNNCPSETGSPDHLLHRSSANALWLEDCSGLRCTWSFSNSICWGFFSRWRRLILLQPNIQGAKNAWDMRHNFLLKLYIAWHHKRLKHAIPRPNDSTLLFVKWKNPHSSTVSNAAWQHITFCVTLTSVANMSHVFAAVAPTGFPAVHFLLSRAGPFVKFGHPCTGDIKWCYHDKLQPSWCLNQPIWNIWSSNWKSSPNSREHNKYLKPPPSKYQSVASTCQTTLAVFPFPFQARQPGGTREKKGHLLPLAPLA